MQRPQSAGQHGQRPQSAGRYVGRRPQPGTPSLAARSARSNAPESPVHETQCVTRSAQKPAFPMLVRPASVAFEPNSVPLGACRQVPGRTPASDLLVELMEAQYQATMRLRHALLSAGQVRQPPTAPQPDEGIVPVGSTADQEPQEADVHTENSVASASMPEPLASASESVPEPSASHDCFGSAEPFPSVNWEQPEREMDYVEAMYVKREEQKMRANQWISECTPKSLKALVDECAPARLNRNMQVETRRLRAIVLRKRGGTSFQAYVDRRHKGKSYCTATLRNLGAGGYEEDVQSSESSSSASTQDGTLGGLKSLFQVVKKRNVSAHAQFHLHNHAPKTSGHYGRRLSRPRCSTGESGSHPGSAAQSSNTGSRVGSAPRASRPRCGTGGSMVSSRGSVQKKDSAHPTGTQERVSFLNDFVGTGLEEVQSVELPSQSAASPGRSEGNSMHADHSRNSLVSRSSFGGDDRSPVRNVLGFMAEPGAEHFLQRLKG